MNTSLRQEVIARFNSRCVLCVYLDQDWDFFGEVDVHHIDGNEQNNDPENLCPLCHEHHDTENGVHHNPKLNELLLKILKIEEEDLDTLQEIALQNRP